MSNEQRNGSFAPRKDHIPVLDGLRAIAVLLVLWAHIPADTFGGVVRVLYFFVKPGYLGVDIFFVLSGFLITRILLVERSRGRPLRLFLFRRFLRIFPIYYLTLAVMVFFEPGEYLLWCAAYLSNYYFPYHPGVNPMLHTWSLAVEEHFYLVWPFVVYGLSIRRSRAVALWGFMSLAAVSALYVTLTSSVEFTEGMIFRASNFRCASLAMGALFAYGENWIRARRAHALRLALFLSLPGIALLSTGQGLEYFLGIDRWSSMIRLFGFTGCSGAILLIAIAFSTASNPISILLCNAPMKFIGRVSYGIYLYHYPIYMALGVLHHEPGHPPAWWTALLAAGCAIGVAGLSYRLIEGPILRWKDRFH